jgi:hypothetical protein
MSAVASSAPALALYGVPLGSLLTNGAGVAAPGNIVGVAGVPSNPLYITKVPNSGYYRFILNGFVNATNAPAVTGVSFFLYSDTAATVKVGDMTLAFPPAAQLGTTYVPFTVQNTFYLAASAELLTMRVVVSGSSSTIYNTFPPPFGAGATTGLSIYWQPI